MRDRLRGQHPASAGSAHRLLSKLGPEDRGSDQNRVAILPARAVHEQGVNAALEIEPERGSEQVRASRFSAAGRCHCGYT
jgi:hypothetical protein